MNKLIELIKYSFFGVITTAINLILFAILKEIGVYYILANTIAYFIAVVINYIFNVRFVFNENQDQDKIEKNMQFIKFIGLRIVSLGVDNACFFVLVSILTLPVYLSRVGLSIVIIMATYIINKFFVFNKRR